MKKLLYTLVLVIAGLSSCTCGSKDKEACKGTENPNSLSIIATLDVYPEFKDELWSAVEAVVEGTRKEEGNICYKVYIDADNPLKWTFIEHWKSQEAIDSHNGSEHFKAFASKVEGKAQLSVSILKPAL
ncbi:MAG: antibiotic biosynthesis monooxygenase [Dysgonamonadaceae bacterium]|jgi:quinol monooxygenase YgiN|nr:antibiotic biosynthesis monooxygenase [Dysgonamonadaceae bacterium]